VFPTVVVGMNRRYFDWAKINFCIPHSRGGDEPEISKDLREFVVDLGLNILQKTKTVIN